MTTAIHEPAIRVLGGQPLRGRIAISGAKNAALKLMAASLLTDQPLTLDNVPQLLDTVTMAELLGHHGVAMNQVGNQWTLQARDVAPTDTCFDLVRTIRASIVLLGPLLARCGYVRLPFPGGDAIGNRKIDYHLQGLQLLGATVQFDDGFILAEAPNGLHGATMHFPNVTVTGTENVLMAACLAKGTSVLHNVAREPEVGDLIACLNSMGARIEGAGSETLTVHGVDRLLGAQHRVIPDRIETGTYAFAAAMTGGDLLLTGANPDHLQAELASLAAAGAQLQVSPEGLRVTASQDQTLQGVDVITDPYPGFATDLQAQLMAMMTRAQGASLITETIYENRLRHVPELQKLGANITVHGQSALVRGVEQLHGAVVSATDIRASVCLVLAGLVAAG
ncbi:MAG: UDP-N-acetylglucosamine 1-carboxyvinyltransferase, partial [Alphaproteobacteria bacterium]|nr:UDP-N-acetylglucosamine 1-carboxyvinyltransferase [Alphaproteobacteria bacterium]